MVLPGNEDRERAWLAHFDECGRLARIASGDIGTALLEGQGLPVAPLNGDDSGRNRTARLGLDENAKERRRFAFSQVLGGHGNRSCRDLARRAHGPEARPDRVRGYRRTQLQPAFEPFELRPDVAPRDFATLTDPP